MGARPAECEPTNLETLCDAGREAAVHQLWNTWDLNFSVLYKTSCALNRPMHCDWEKGYPMVGYGKCSHTVQDAVI